jgi:uncharacterized membrane protein YtjA (UPF0391 family)
VRIATSVTARPTLQEYTMLTWTLIFLVISLVAGALGFSGVSGAAAGVARVLFMIFLIALVVSLILGIVHGFTWHTNGVW